MPTDFAYYLTKYLSGYLAGQRNFSDNTIASYRDAFKLLLRFCKEEKGIRAENLSLESFSKTLVNEFVTWLNENRHCTESTRNQRLTVIRNFFSFLQEEAPEHLFLCQSIMKIKGTKKTGNTVNYLSFDGVKSILECPDQRNRQGRRDLVMLTMLYDTGARVQEIADVRVRDLRLTNPPGVNLLGKGRKWRHVPLMRATADLLRDYLEEQELTSPNALEHPLFTNRSGQKLTRTGISYILRKYVAAAREVNPSHIPPKVTPHAFRHSKAMHLLQSGIDLIYIRDLLGHSHVKTTEIYARTDSKAKREALESVYRSPSPNDRPLWTDDAQIMKMLQSLG